MCGSLCGSLYKDVAHVAQSEPHRGLLCLGTKIFEDPRFSRRQGGGLGSRPLPSGPGVDDVIGSDLFRWLRVRGYHFG